MKRACRYRSSYGQIVAGALLLVALVGCERGLEPIRYGVDVCAECRMVIDQPRFTASILTPRGRTLKFDSIECLLRFLDTQPELPNEEDIFVSVDDTGRMISAGQAFFDVDGDIRSPMGGGMLAYEERRPGALSWQDILARPRSQ